jgi:hypothetical protein
MMGIEAEKVAQGTGLSLEEINGIAEEVKASRH